jgi:heat shock protein HslJ
LPSVASSSTGPSAGSTDGEPGSGSGRQTAVRTRVIAIVATVGLAVGCGGASSSASKQPPPGPSPPSVSGRTFISTAVVGHRLAAGTHLQITFTRDERISVNAGCNTLGAGYHIDAAQLVVDALAGTEMGCDPDRMAQDQWIGELLQSKPELVVATDGITLRSGTTTLTLRDRKVIDPDRPLVATTWIVDSEIDRSTVSSVPLGANARIRLATNQRIDVYEGCKHMSGSVQMRQTSFTVRDLVGTAPAKCAGPPAFSFGRVLPGAVRFEIDADRLTLTNADGFGFAFHAEAG